MSTVKGKVQQEMRIIQGLQEMFPNEPFTLAELKHPTRDFVLRFYLAFLCNIGVNCDALCEVPPAMQAKFGDSYLLRRVSLALRDVFNKILVTDPIAPFNMLDLLQPAHGRTAAFFLAMCNFMYFCVDKLSIIDQYIDDLQAGKKEFDELIEKREAFRQKLNEEAQIRARISDLETEVGKKQQELRNLAEDGKAADQRVAEKENAMKNLQVKLEQLNKDFSELQQERASAEALVVKSPMAVKNQKSLLEQKLKEADEKTAAAKDMLTSKREISKKLETLGEELESRTCLLKKIIAEAKEISKDTEETEEFRRKLSKLQVDLDERNAERQKLREKELHLQETESGMAQRFEKKKADFQGMLKSMRRDLDDLIKQTSAEKISVQNALDKGYGEISRLVNTYSALCKKYEDLYATLLLKEKSIGDEAVSEAQELIARFQKRM